MYVYIYICVCIYILYISNITNKIPCSFSSGPRQPRLRHDHERAHPVVRPQERALGEPLHADGLLPHS